MIVTVVDQDIQTTFIGIDMIPSFPDCSNSKESSSILIFIKSSESCGVTVIDYGTLPEIPSPSELRTSITNRR